MVSSSLTGVMGDFGMTSSPNASPSGMAWTPSPTSGMSDGYVLVQEGNIAPYMANTSLHSESPPTSMLPYASYNSSSYSTGGSSPPHLPGLPSPTGYADSLSYASSRQGVMQQQVISPPLTGSPLGMPINVSPPPSATPGMRSSRSSLDGSEEEMEFLRNRVRELERQYAMEHDRVEHLKQELTRITYGGLHSANPGGLPTPIPSPAVTQSYNEGWRCRTGARVKLFCSLNRAGNALCAWHDSRRERRAHPPRMAPPGHLNCGCTYDEALFEESLARHGVGSYHPGENVRMDPALRNPLLKLLQERYNYRDGDFERDPVTGEWLEGEGPDRWEARASSGQPANKKIRLDDRR